MNVYGVILFFTTSSAMQTEKLLKKEGYTVKLIPTPRQFSSDCGIALRFDWDIQENVRIALETARIEYETLKRMT